jgi:AcrR family transcriptional regulator
MVASPSNTLHPFGEEDGSKRRQILDGARKVFMDLGFDGASMNEIARAAGVSKGTLYLYYPSKEELLKSRTAPRILLVTNDPIHPKTIVKVFAQ